MSGYTAIDLSRLPAPQVVEALDFETILTEMIADLKARDPSFSAILESDPAIKILEVAAFREVNLRARINEAAKACMIAYARGADLDNLAALTGVVRLVVDPGDADASPPIAPTLEDDESFRRRAQLALEGFSTAGPDGAYLFHALSASAKVRDVGVKSPAPGEVLVTVLSADGDGSASEREAVGPLTVTLVAGEATLDGMNIGALIVKSSDEATTFVAGVDYVFTVATSKLRRLAGGGIAAGATLKVNFERAAVLELVRLRLADDNVRPLTDSVTVQSAEVLGYAVDAALSIYPGPDPAVVAAEARRRLDEYVASHHRVGDAVTVSGLHAALSAPGVWKVALTTPAADILATDVQAPFCTGITIATTVGSP